MAEWWALKSIAAQENFCDLAVILLTIWRLDSPDPVSRHRTVPLMHCTAPDSTLTADWKSGRAVYAQAHFEVGPVCDGCMRGTLATKDFQVSRALWHHHL